MLKHVVFFHTWMLQKGAYQACPPFIEEKNPSLMQIKSAVQKKSGKLHL